MILGRYEEGDFYYRTEYPIAEPVPRFGHSRRAPLVVFASFEDGKVTHIADGRKGASAGTDLVRLNMKDLEPLARAIGFDEIVDGVSPRVRPHLRRVLSNGGLLPPKTRGEVVDRILELDSSIGDRLSRFSARRRESIRRLTSTERGNLAFQKEALGMALEIAGLSREELLSWQPGEAEQRSFLDGLPEIRVREDVMLLSDFSSVPGFTAIGEATHYGAKTFEDLDNRGVRLTVIMANRLPLERQTGADLIYFNERYRSFVMVQYKAMESGDNGAEFRWNAGDQLSDEIARMDSILGKLNGTPADTHPDGYRLSEDPFFLKFCPRVVFNPDDNGLFKGIYLPLDLWKRNASSGRLRGPKGGNLLTFENVGRRISNSEFVGLVGNSWVGTTIGQSAVLEDLIRAILESGRTVAFAIKHPTADASGEPLGSDDPPDNSGATDSESSVVQ